MWKGEAIGFGQQENLARRFIHALGSPNYLSNDSMCYAARYIGYKLVLGGWPSADLENARCIVLWGANPPYAHPNMTQYVTARAPQGRDARGRRPAALGDRPARRHPRGACCPGTDGALAWGLVRPARRDRAPTTRTSSSAAPSASPGVVEYARAFTPEVVERETGVPAATRAEHRPAMAAAAPRVALYVGNGLEHHENGVNNIRAIVSLDALLGALDQEGGTLFKDAAAAARPDAVRRAAADASSARSGADRFPVLYDLRQRVPHDDGPRRRS